MPEIRIEIVIRESMKLLILTLSRERALDKLSESKKFIMIAIYTAITDCLQAVVVSATGNRVKLFENVCVIAVDNL